MNTTTQRVLAEATASQPWPLRVLLKLLSRIRVGRMKLVATDGSVFFSQGEEPGPEGVIHVRHIDAVRRTLWGGDLGLAEAYMDGQWTTPDLMTFLELGLLNLKTFSVDKPGLLRRMLNGLVHALRRNTRKGARRNIQYHYDLGNAFYKLWLDETLTYSSAIFESPNDTLLEAQYHKYDRLLEKLELCPEHHLLEIGSGWGGFALYAASKIGCRVTSITLSQEQLKEACIRSEAAGLAERVKFELVDYRDVQGEFDRIVSIEMFEAVGERYWDDYFKAVHDRLKPGGRAAFQIITIHDEAFEQYRHTVDFIQRYIFPGGMLPSPSAWEACVQRAGLKTEAHDFHGQHYARTLRLWNQNVQRTEDEILRQGFDARFLRMWHYYLAYCHAGFISGHVDLMQASIVRPA